MKPPPKKKTLNLNLYLFRLQFPLLNLLIVDILPGIFLYLLSIFLFWNFYGFKPLLCANSSESH